MKGYWHLKDSGFPEFSFLSFYFPYFIMQGLPIPPITPECFLTHILPRWNFFTKFCCQRRFLTKSKWIYMVLFLKKKTNLVQKSQNIFSSVDANRRRVQVFFKKKTKCLGSNKNVNVALFWVVVQSKHLWHWKRYFTLILKFCLNYP